MKCLKTAKPKQDSAVYDFMIKKESEGKPLKVAKIAALNNSCISITQEQKKFINKTP